MTPNSPATHELDPDEPTEAALVRIEVEPARATTEEAASRP